MIKGRVTILGRPNVGKSTLFNLLTKSKNAIVADRPGVTRDILIGKVKTDEEIGFEICDTGGYETKGYTYQPFKQNIVWKQTKSALENCDLVLMLLDAKEGLQIFDEELIKIIKQLDCPVIFAVNKVDGKEQNNYLWDFQRIATDELLAISAAHNRGIRELKDKIIEQLKTLNVKRSKQDKLTTDPDTLTIIGRPNVGKSSIINRVLGSERVLVSPVSGTTRDSIEVQFTYNKKTYNLIDTAGLRRKQKINDHIESESTKKSIQAIYKAKIVICVIAAEQGIADQDTRLIQFAIKHNKPVLLIVNKWDLNSSTENNAQENYKKNIFNNSLRDSSFIKVHFMSCLHNKRVMHMMNQVEDLLQQVELKVPTAQVNKIITEISTTHSPRLVASSLKRPKFYYATQVKTNPPTIVVKCNVPSELEKSYQKYFIKQLQKKLGFKNIPIVVLFRDKNKEKKTA
jgi:GTPase